MVERIGIIIVLSVVGWVAYRLFVRRHVQQIAIKTADDPILGHLKMGIPAIVYFTTPDCVPCRTQQKPALARLSEELGDAIQIITIDACADPEAAARWGVFSSPTTFVLDGMGQPRQVNYGVADAQTLKRQVAPFQAQSTGVVAA